MAYGKESNGHEMKPGFGPEWESTRQMVIERAAGLCERCKASNGTYVHHLRYWPELDRPRGGEPLEWLQFVCGPCHQLYHPYNTIWGGTGKIPRPKPTKIRKPRKVKRHRNCQHCGGLWTKEKHRRICVKFGLAHPTGSA